MIRSSIDVIGHALIRMADLILSDHFFDPHAEDAYKEAMASFRSTKIDRIPVLEHAMPFRSSICIVRVQGLRTWTRFRITMTHDTYVASVEGNWSFDHQELSHIDVTHGGNSDALTEAIQAISDELTGRSSEC